MNKRFADSLHTTFPLLLALFIDGMGFAILFPILSDIIIEPTGILPPATSLTARHFWYALTFGSFCLCWFLGTAIVSDLSDRIGRKKALVICLVGSFIGYALSAIAILYKSIWLLIIGRIIDGFTVGSQPIAQAAIIDLSTPETKTRNLGLTLLAPSLGFILGPIIGGTLANPAILSWFNTQVPMYFAALISLLNAGMIAKWFSETRSYTSKFSISISRSLEVFFSAFRSVHIRRLSIAMLVEVLAWSCYFEFITLFLMKTHHFSVTAASLYMAVMGIGFGLGSSFLTRWFDRLFDLRTNTLICCGLALIGFYITATTQKTYLLWLFCPWVAGFSICVYTFMLSAFSSHADDQSQGWIMGVTNSTVAFAFSVSALMGGWLINISTSAPLWVAIGMYVLFMVLSLYVMPKQQTATIRESTLL